MLTRPKLGVTTGRTFPGFRLVGFTTEMVVRFLPPDVILGLRLRYVALAGEGEELLDAESMQSQREKSPSRRYEQPAKFREEQRWFSSSFLRPGDVPASPRLESDNMAAFKDLIWNYPTREILRGYGSTPEELARLCGQGPDGWLCSSHITWILDRANEAQSTALCLSLSTSSLVELLRLIGNRDVGQVEKLVFVASVGKNPDNSVYLASPQRSGSHWVLITVDLMDCPTINYCDSSGWDSPPNLLQVLAQYTQLFGLTQLNETHLHLMHIPTPAGYNHLCTAGCRNFPLQTCSSVCGLVAVVGSVIAALDPHLFKLLTGPQSDLRIYLHEPTRYEEYLRRVVISWFVANAVDMTLVWQWQQPGPPNDTPNTNFHERFYSAAASGRKRKAADTAHAPTSGKSQAQTASNSSPPSANSRSYTSNTQSAQNTKPHTGNSNSQTTGQNARDTGTSNTQAPVQNTMDSTTYKRQAPEYNGTSNTQSCGQNTQVPGQNTELADNCNTRVPGQKTKNTGTFNTQVSRQNTKPHAAYTQATGQNTDTDSHAANTQTNTSKSKVHRKSEYICSYCNLRVTTRQALFKHKQRKHSKEPSDSQTQKTAQCVCRLCPDFKCITIRDQIAHYQSQHDQDIQIRTITFNNEEEFNAWRKQVEKDTASQYIRITGSKTYKEQTTTYYYCRRSGQEKPDGITDRKRARKSRGSCKMGFKCTSFMIVRKNSFGTRLNVEYCLQHSGHSMELEHLNISDDLRSLIVEKLAQGVETTEILDDRDKMIDTTQDSLVTRKDINVKNQYNISGTQDHHEDGVSTCSDFLTKAISCRHIPAVHEVNAPTEQSVNNEDVEPEDHTDIFKALLCQDKPEISHQVEKLKQAVMSKASDIMELANETNDITILQAVFQHLQDAYNVGCGLQDHSTKSFKEKNSLPIK